MSRANNDSSGGLRLLLLGSPSLVDGQGDLIPGMGPGKPLAMLSYLAINGASQRDELVALLWPEMPEDRARNAFRQTLHRVRGALGPEIIATDRESISVNLGAQMWCDAVVFQRSASADPKLAISLYRGPFLGGLSVGAAPFEQWAESQRERLEAQYRGALATAVNLALEDGERDEAVELAGVLSRAAPLDPQAAVLEAKVLVAAGRKPEAISVLSQHGARIESELGAKPAASVSALLQRLVKDAPVAGTAPAPTSDLLPEAEFVGRDREIGKLLALWRAIESRGATAIITGPPGIGKTRLLRELVQRTSAFGPALLLWGQERYGNRTIPYAALADALRPAVNAPGVAGASQSLLAEAARLLPEIRDQFNLPEARPLDDDAARIRFFDGVASLLDAVAFEQPVCLVVEDLHHASRSSVELLQFLTQRLAKAPILFLISFRAAESPPYVLERFGSVEQVGDDIAAGAGESDPAVTRLPLPLLDAEAIERMIASVVQPGELEVETLPSMVAMAEGNPFRALDLVRRARRGEPLAKPPVELSASLWVRLQSCSPQEQRFFLASALLGRPASLRLLAAATHLAEPVAFDAAIALEQRGLIVQQRGGVSPAHDVLAAVALEGTGSAGRALLAGWTADALASDIRASNAELAQLYAEAGQPSSAHRYARAAILDAAASGAEDELGHLLAMAAQTALNNEDRRAVQSLRTALYGDARRLGKGDAGVGASAEGTAERQLDTEQPRQERSIPRRSAGPAGWFARYKRASQIAAVGVVAVIASAAYLQTRDSRPGARGTVLGDSVVVAERIDARRSRQYLVTGSMLPAATLRDRGEAPEPAWIRDLALPWVNPKPSPDGRHVALEQITPQGTNIYVVSASRRDTIPLAVGAGDDLIGGWSPDGRWLLVIQGSVEGGHYRSRLHVYSLQNPAMPVTMDSTADRSVVDAVWSPTGTRIAWTARSGPTRQQDVFVGTTDGAEVSNVTNSASEEYHVAWSPDGERLVFTSDREGNAEIYSLELATNALRRLTFDAAQDDRAAYSPDGDFIAFESTRGGHVGIYATPPLGGSARRLTPEGRNFELLGWRGRAPSYVEELRASVPAALAPGGRSVLSATAVDQYGETMAAPALDWRSLDEIIELDPLSTDLVDADASFARAITARGSGLARIVARADAWRADTAFVLVGPPFGIVTDDFDGGMSLARWTPLGAPTPVVSSGAGVGGGGGLVLRSDRQWESGVLGTNIIPLRPGLSVSARVRAPFAAAGQPGGFTIALVAAEAGSSLDSNAPQFLKIVALSWLSEAGRLAYSAEREFWSEAVRFERGEDWHSFRMEVEPDGRIAFYVEDRLRRRSSIVVTGKPTDTLVQLWIGARATGDEVVVDDVRLRLAGQR